MCVCIRTRTCTPHPHIIIIIIVVVVVVIIIIRLTSEDAECEEDKDYVTDEGGGNEADAKKETADDCDGATGEAVTQGRRDGTYDDIKLSMTVSGHLHCYETIL